MYRRWRLQNDRDCPRTFSEWFRVHSFRHLVIPCCQCADFVVGPDHGILSEGALAGAIHPLQEFLYRTDNVFRIPSDIEENVNKRNQNAGKDAGEHQDSVDGIHVEEIPGKLGSGDIPKHLQVLPKKQSGLLLGDLVYAEFSDTRKA